MKIRLGTTLSLAIFMGVMALGSLSAYADNDRNRGHGHQDNREYSRYEHRGHGDRRDYYSYQRYHDGYRQRVVYFTPSYQPRYQTIYYGARYPYGVSTYYQVGDYLPRGVRCYEPPRNVVAVLPPVRRGTEYVQVNQDVYLISEATKQILDAVVLMSGVR